MNSESQKQLDELKAEREAECKKLPKQRKEREASFEAKRRETKIQTVMSQRRDFTRGDAELYVDSGLYDKQSNQPRAIGMHGPLTIGARLSGSWRVENRKIADPSHYCPPTWVFVHGVCLPDNVSYRNEFVPTCHNQSLADFGLFLVMAHSEIFQANRGKNCQKSFRPAPIEAKEAARPHDHHESN